MALQIRGNTQIMQASVSLDRLDSNGGSLHGAVSINNFSSSSATITGGTINNTSVTSGSGTFGSGTFTGALTHTGDSAGVKFHSLYADLDYVDIDGGNIDNVTIATSDITVGTNKTLDVSAGTLTLADNQISGNKILGGVIDSVGIGVVDIDGGTIDGTTISTSDVSIDSGKSLSGAGSFIFDSASSLSFAVDQINGSAIANGSLTNIAVDGSLNLGSLNSMGDLTIGVDMISGNSIHGGDISGDVDFSGDEVEIKTGKFTAGSGNFIVDSIGNVIAQNLTVQGTTTTVNSEVIELADNFILLNSNIDSGGYGFNSGIEVKRDANDNTNVKLEWKETETRWSVGSKDFEANQLYATRLTGNVTGDLKGDVLYSNNSKLLDQANGRLYGHIYGGAGNNVKILDYTNGELTGNAATSSKWQTARVVTFAGGDVHGTFSIDGNANVDSVGLTIQSGSVEYSMLSSNAILNTDSGADTDWNGATDSQLVSAKDIKEYVDNSTNSGLAAKHLSFKIGENVGAGQDDAMTNVKYNIEDHEADTTEAGNDHIDLNVAVNSDYETLADVYMNGQKLRYGADSTGGDYYFTVDNAGDRKRIKFNSINIELGDVVEAKFFIAE